MIETNSRQVDLDDSSVSLINRSADRIVIKLIQCRAKQESSITVTVHGVTEEEVRYFVGENITAPHPEPAQPLDFIEYAEQGDDFLYLGGYRNSDSWFDWRIRGTKIDIERRCSEASGT